MTELSDFLGFVEENRAAVNERLDQLLASKDSEADSLLQQAMRYSTCGGGKRLRAMLCLAGYNLGRKLDESILSIAASIEMLHAFTLVHDDMPCMDDDDFRRGEPSCHKKFDEAVALLAGDALHNRGYRVFLSAAKNVYPPAVSLEALEELVCALGEVVSGQVVDVISAGKEISRETLQYIHLNKTASLIRASILVGGILSQIGAEKIAKLRKFSVEVGLAFQIVDDILGVEGDFSTTGKKGQSDLEKDKPTYPKLYSLEGAVTEARACQRRAMTHLSELENVGALAGFSDYIISRIPPKLLKGNGPGA